MTIKNRHIIIGVAVLAVLVIGILMSRASTADQHYTYQDTTGYGCLLPHGCDSTTNTESK